tara:strand:- start:49 stop:2457 length:2409 start_codon:yes stop_codon:yes gene_type:complete
MAFDPKKLSNDIKELNKMIDQMYKKLGRRDTPPVFKASEISAARREIKKLDEDLNEVNSSLSFISKSFRDSIAEVSKMNTELGYAKKALRGMESVARELRIENEKGLAVDKETLEKLQKKAQLERNSLKVAIDSGRITGANLREFKDNLKTADEFLATMEKVAEQTAKIKGNLGVKTFGFMEEFTESIPGLKAFAGPFKEAREEAERTAKTNLEMVGQTDGLSKKQIKALKKIQEFKDKSKTEDLSKDASGKAKRKKGDIREGGGLDREMMKKIAKKGGIEDLVMGKDGNILAGKGAQNRAGKLLAGNDLAKSVTGGKSPLMAGFKKLFSKLGTMFKRALGPLALLKELMDAIKGLDKAAADMAKQFGMTYNDSLQMNKEFTQMAAASGEIFVNTKGIRDTFIAVNSALGTNVQLSEDMAVSFTKLREMSGFTNEELQGIARIQLGTNKTTDEITGQFMAQAKISATQNGVLLNEQQLLKNIDKISAATTLSFGKNPGLIGEAVATAKSLGMELSKVENIAESLLNFEESIENELQAELLLGKNINLEKARQAALNNDLATVAKEISDQIGSSAEFTKMNRIQQEALAKSVGMNREDLAETLLLEDNLKGLTGEKAEEARKNFQILKDTYGLAEAQRILEEEGVEQLNNQVGVQEQFNATIAKLKEIFVVIANAIMPILSAVASLVKLLDPVIQILMMAGAVIQDIISGIGFLFGGDFGQSAIVEQGRAIERSMEKNYGFSAGLYDNPTITGPNMALERATGIQGINTSTGNTEVKTDNSDVVAAINNMSGKLNQGTLYEIS